MNAELLALYQADRHERVDQPHAPSPAYTALCARDVQRRARVLALVAANALQTADDYYHAAWIMNHGDTPGDAAQAHRLALRAADLGSRPARWLAAASYDRWQMYQGKPQKYGTNYVFDGQRDRLWDVDPTTTDAERAAWDVPPLAEQLRKAAEVNRHRVPLSEEDQRAFEAQAPAWLQPLLQRWREEADNAA